MWAILLTKEDLTEIESELEAALAALILNCRETY